VIAVLLPDLSGFDLARAIADRNVPVLLMSEHPENQDSCRSYEFPHIAKPFRPSELISLGRRVLRHAEENIVRVREACARLDNALGCAREAAQLNQLWADSCDRVTHCMGGSVTASPILFCRYSAGTLVPS
jgi:DNA-binding response OmpR family regulator